MTKSFLFFLLFLLSLSALRAQEVKTLIGSGVKGFSGDGGPADKAQLNNVYAVARGPDGYLYLCDMDNDRVRRVSPEGIIETYAGNGNRAYSGDGGPATSASLNEPYEMAWDRNGNLLIVELGNHCIRRVDAKTRLISTVAGSGKPGFSGDGGPASKAHFRQPHSLAFDSRGDLFICDIGNHRIRKIEMESGRISTFSGDGQKKTSPDGSSIGSASLFGPRALVFGKGDLAYLALREGNAILLLDRQANTIRQIAGTGKSGFTGNGGPALLATLSGPKGIALAPNGDVYFADTESHTIRYIDMKKGTVELLVGDGQKGDGPDGAPQKCRLNRPHGVFVDRDGAIYIGDSENHRIRVWKK